MGHLITGIITRKSDAKSIAAKIPFKQFHNLNQNFVIFPLTDDLIDMHIPSPQRFKFKQFTYLSEELINILSQASSGKLITYIETEYFGGEGVQAAIVFENGKIIFGPKQADIGPINNALKKMGVSKEPACRDEFESIGLASFRSCDEILDDE
jgi:hypothetical protein